MERAQPPDAFRPAFCDREQHRYLARNLRRAEATWDHGAFLDYVDRCMHEEDAVYLQAIQDATGRDHDKSWARQGQAWDAFVNDTWAAYRTSLQVPTDGWRLPHDDAYYRNAIRSAGVTR